jgi:hypothetical protein
MALSMQLYSEPKKKAKDITTGAKEVMAVT